MTEVVVERRAAAPPVRNACMSCRALKTRCDGGHPCSSCQIRARDCTYRPSRRGGARVRRNRHTSEQSQYPSSETSVEEIPQQPLPIESFIQPGAGLKQLPDLLVDSDFLFDSLFLPGTLDVPQATFSPVPVVRAYQSDYAILEAYYVYIHPFFPILPPPIAAPVDLAISRPQDHVPEFESTSPLGLAISAILALIPCHDDLSYQSQESLLFRRKFAHYLAQSAIEIIENEKEIPESVAPSDALAGESEEYPRQRFHPGVPPELEEIVTLDILSFYEYAQRGNLKKMQSRANQAFSSALNLSLHDCPDGDEISEVKSRIWWMTATIVSNSEPTPLLNSTTFTTKYPSLEADCDAFGLFIQAQKALLACTRFAAEVVKRVKSNGDLSPISERMIELEHQVEALTTAADSWVLLGSSTSPVDSTEDVVSRALRCMARVKLNSARIKVHRFCAFFDNPIFPGKYCDLESTSIEFSPDFSNVLAPSAVDLLPFSRHESTRICLRAALNVAQSFNELPLPNPLGQDCAPPCYLAPTSTLIAPRLVPSLACCAMQCTYTLVMVQNRMEPAPALNTVTTPFVESLLVHLQTGIKSVCNVFENYATAFEAIGGMRDRVRGVISYSSN